VQLYVVIVTDRFLPCWHTLVTLAINLSTEEYIRSLGTFGYLYRLSLMHMPFDRTQNPKGLIIWAVFCVRKITSLFPMNRLRKKVALRL